MPARVQLGASAKVAPGRLATPKAQISEPCHLSSSQRREQATMPLSPLILPVADRDATNALGIGLVEATITSARTPKAQAHVASHNLRPRRRSGCARSGIGLEVRLHRGERGYRCIVLLVEGVQRNLPLKDRVGDEGVQQAQVVTQPKGGEIAQRGVAGRCRRPDNAETTQQLEQLVLFSFIAAALDQLHRHVARERQLRRAKGRKPGRGRGKLAEQVDHDVGVKDDHCSLAGSVLSPLAELPGKGCALPQVFAVGPEPDQPRGQ